MCEQNAQTPPSEQVEEGPVFGEAAGSEGSAQAFLSEISEEDVEALHQREEAVLQIEVRTTGLGSLQLSTCVLLYLFLFNVHAI